VTASIDFRLKDTAISESEKLRQRQSLLRQWHMPLQDLHPAFSEVTFDPELVGKKNCENLVGQVSIPVGVAGPVRVKGETLNQEVLLPLATTEGALVASISRGCKVLNQAGGAEVMVKKVGMSRAPVFKCRSGSTAHEFLAWVSTQEQRLQQLCETTSSHLHWGGYQAWVRGRYVYIRCVFDTEEAMGMNMVTIALQHAWGVLLQEQPDVELISISSNVCSDKKDSVINRLLGRGYAVQAEVEISEAVLSEVTKVTSAQLAPAHMAKNLIGSNLAGSFSQNMQAANVVAAMFAATGQDLAQVVGSSQVNTQLEATDSGLYVAINIPSLELGTVGGGTYLAAQSQVRTSMLASGNITAEQLAAAVGVGVLAGEISGLAALTTQTLASAHQQLGRLQV